MTILTDIPGFERRKLHCIDSNEDFSKVFIAGRIIGELRGKYATSVAYFSTRDTAMDIERLQESYSDLIGNLYAIDLEDRDVHKLCDMAAGMIEKKFVRAIIIDCLEGLEIGSTYYKGGVRAKRNEIKTNLYLLAASSNVPVLLFCPYRKSHKYDKEIYTFLADILPQMNQ